MWKRANREAAWGNLQYSHTSPARLRISIRKA
jgi:hypothetical protein